MCYISQDFTDNCSAISYYKFEYLFLFLCLLISVEELYRKATENAKIILLPPPPPLTKLTRDEEKSRCIFAGLLPLLGHTDHGKLLGNTITVLMPLDSFKICTGLLGSRPALSASEG